MEDKGKLDRNYRGITVRMRSKKPKDEEKNVDLPEGKCQTFLTSLCLYVYLALVFA